MPLKELVWSEGKEPISKYKRSPQGLGGGGGSAVHNPELEITFNR